MKKQTNSCCSTKRTKEKQGILSGILFGLLPHSFCLAFILLSVFGAVTATAFLKQILIIPNFLTFLIALSLILATVSSIIYLYKKNCLCLNGIKEKWKYLLSVYSVIMVVNLLMFFVVFPVLANFKGDKNTIASTSTSQDNLSSLIIKTQIPCSGHAPLIIDEIKQNKGIVSVNFSMPNVFKVVYDPQRITPEKIISSQALKTYQATIN